jgi:tetratricopeptide (TPR) repeat protein
MFRVVFSMAVIVIGLLATPVLAEGNSADQEACFDPRVDQPADVDNRIAACSRVVDDGTIAADIRAQAHLRRAMSYGQKATQQNAGGVEDALADLSEAARLVSDNTALALLIRADLYLHNGDPERAITEYTRLIDLEPKSARAYARRGAAYSAKGAYDQAIADFDESVRLEPRAPTFYLDRAVARIASRDYDRAISDLSSAIRLDPDNLAGIGALAHAMKGDVYSLNSDFDHALDDYSEALRLSPKTYSFYIDRAAVWVGKRDYGHAINDYNEAIALRPNDSAIYANRGLARFYSGDFASAEDDFARITDKAVKPYATLWVHLSRARAAAGDASEQLSAVVTLNQVDNWPLPIFELFLKKRTPEATLAAATNDRERCEAQFYIGQWNLIGGEFPVAAQAFNVVIDACPASGVEHRAALEELRRLRQ